MECLDEIKKLNIREVSDKTHISVIEIEAILRKDYKRFNYTKAVGFTKIFKRDYNIDLTPWLEEYETETGGKRDEGIFVISDEKEAMNLKAKLIYVAAAILVIFAVILVYSAVNSSNIDVVVENNQVVEKAKQTIEESNKTEESTQIDAISEELVLATTQAPVAEEDDATEPEEKEVVVEEPEEKKVAIFSRQKLWISVKDNNTGKKKSTIMEGEYLLDSDGDFTIVFGHGYFDLINGDKTEVSKNKDIQQYRYRDGEFTKERYIAPAKPKPKPKVEEKTEKVESNVTSSNEESSIDVDTIKQLDQENQE